MQEAVRGPVQDGVDRAEEDGPVICRCVDVNIYTHTTVQVPGLVVKADDDAGPGQSLQQAARLLAPVVPEVGQAPGQ